METDSLETGQGVELLANIRRLTTIVLDRLEKGSAEGTLDQGQVRMLSSTALRSLKLWKEALGEAKESVEAEAVLARKPGSASKRGNLA